MKALLFTSRQQPQRQRIAYGMIGAIIFDLDNCLSAADEPGRALLEPMFEAIRRTNSGKLSEDALERAFRDCWRHPLDVVANTHGFSPAMLAAGWAVGLDAEVHRPMRGYGDLDALSALPAMLFLVTSGFRRLQESKIAALGLRHRFTEIRVDAIDEPNRKGKRIIFDEILTRHQVQPGEALVVGDNPDSEIAAGNQLGIRTVQILRPGVPRGVNATHYIHQLVELRGLLRGDRDQ